MESIQSIAVELIVSITFYNYVALYTHDISRVVCPSSSNSGTKL